MLRSAIKRDEGMIANNPKPDEVRVTSRQGVRLITGLLLAIAALAGL
jgi:hypothetical protein